MIRTVGVLLLSVLLFNFSPAKAESTVDQACLIENASDAVGIDLTEYSAYQLFSPTKDTLDSVVLVLATTSNDITAKVKVKIYRAQDEIGHPDGTLVAEKFAYAQGEGYVKVDFTDFPLEDGIYLISVEAVHLNENVYWVATTGTCYPGGYAVVGERTRVDLDYFFSVYTYNALLPAPENDDEVSSSNAGASPTDSISNDVQEPPLSGLPPDAKVVDASDLSGDAPVNNSNTNTISISSKNLMSDEELQQQITGILKDIEEHHYKGGAFGLSGAVGRTLTWPVFYGLCILILLLIVILIIRSKKKREITDKKPVPPEKE